MIAWHSWGPEEGAPLVALHGIGSNGAGFALFARAAGRRVLAWDMPGYGDSDDAEIGDLDALAAVLLRETPDRFDLLGHSLGCLIAARAARTAPGRVLSLTLASPALGHRVAPPATSEAAAARLGVTDARALADRRAAALLADPGGPALAQVHGQMAALRPAGHHAAARILSAGDLIADAPHLAADVVVGADDAITPPEAARRLHAALGRPGRLTVLPAAGHALAAEAPEALAQSLKEVA